eukprot:GSChrysophyteH1.ASY1.ANO1.880.1 assembled CDS
MLVTKIPVIFRPRRTDALSRVVLTRLRHRSKKYKSFPFAYGEELVLEIEDINNLGYGVSRIELPGQLGAEDTSKSEDTKRWIVTVPTVIPGEKVKVRVFRNNKNYSEADLLEVLSPSPDRVEPRCEHFSVCGGCQYQMAPLSLQRKWKQNQIRDVLQRIGGLDMQEITVQSPLGGRLDYEYRTKITPHYSIPRDNDVLNLKIGFQKRGTRVVTDIDRCVIATKQINTAYGSARERLRSDMIQHGLTRKGATLLFREGFNGHVETEMRALMLQEVSGVRFRYQAGEFFQTNADSLEVLIDAVKAEATGDDCNVLLDCYCGSGLFSLTMHELFDENNAELNGITNTNFTLGSSERIFETVQHLDEDRTVVLIDPPRKGCSDGFLEQLAEFRPRKVIYVSCDPATQSRDSRTIIDSGYSVRSVIPIDMFPQTRHCENIMVFIKVDI